MALIIQIKVIPSSGRSMWKLDSSGLLKRYLKSPAERGLANDELIEVLAKALQIPKQEVTLISGHTDRHKRLKVNTHMTYEQFLEVLGIEQQLKVF